MQNGKLGFVTSSRRHKHDIEPMGDASEALYALKPVTFRYNGDIDPAHVKMFGLIAEDVAQVYPDLAVRNAEGEIIAIRSDSINAMLLNEFLKEHRKVEELQATVAQQQKGMEVLTAQLKEQAAQIQKVSAQLEASKPATESGCEHAVKAKEQRFAETPCDSRKAVTFSARGGFLLCSSSRAEATKLLRGGSPKAFGAGAKTKLSIEPDSFSIFFLTDYWHFWQNAV